MNVVFLMQHSWSEGAPWVVARRRAQYLVDQGDRVTVLVSGGPPPGLTGADCIEVPLLRSRWTRRLDVELVRCVSRIPSTRWQTRLQAKNLVPELLFPGAVERTLRDVASRQPIDVVVSHQCHAPIGLYHSRCFPRPIPVVESPRADIFASVWWKTLGVFFTGYYRWATRQAYRHARMLVPVSEAIGNHAISRGVSPERVCVIGNGVDPGDLGDLQPASRGLHRRAEHELLYVGRYAPYKGLDVLIQALAGARDLSICCRFVGFSEQDAPALLEQASSLGIRDRCVFEGYWPRQHLSAFYRLADALILPSRTEGMANVTVEAMAFGTPVLGTNVGGTPDIVKHDANGLLVPPESAGALANAIRRFCTSAETRQTLSTGARDTAGRFTLPTRLSEFRQLLCNIVSER